MAAPATPAQREERRRQVAALMLRKLTQTEIARRLDCNQSTISHDMAAVRAEWQAARLADTDALMSEELAALALAQQTAVELVESPKPYVQLQAIDRLLAVQDRRAKLLGLDAPTRTQQEQHGDLVIRVEYADADPAEAA